MPTYADILREKLEREVKIATEARRKYLDPAPYPEIHVTKDIAERVEAITSIRGIGKRIRELEMQGYSREEIALKIGDDFVAGRFGAYNRKEEVIENAVRAAMAILTEGVVAAPIEGIARAEIGINDDSSNYIKIFYSGPIRSAGGTAQALSVVIADYVRQKMGFAAYSPREEEIARYVLEVSLYERVGNLQYKPTDEEIRYIIKNCPICIDGDPTEDIEVEAYKDLERVSTNRVRGGMVLVLTEGIAMKAQKIKKYVERLGIKGWEWLDELVVAKEDKGRDFLKDLIAGRPLFCKSSKKGAFRLRYGRSRNSGLAAVGINPATMSLTEFIAVGTQVKLELPGKAGCIVPVDSIEGPTVKLKNGSVLKLNSVDDALKVKDEVVEILDLGEILIDYGDFLENGHILVQGAYSHEWWLKELESVAKEEAGKWRNKKPNQEEAISLSYKYNIPLHPDYTYMWEDITEKDREYLVEYICNNAILEDNKLFIPEDARIKRILEDLLTPHRVFSKSDRKFIVIDHPLAFLRCLGIDDELRRNESLRIKTRNKAPTRLGMRMGRPEKAKQRMMKPAPHSLFPLGEYGGKNRSLGEAVKKRVIEVEIGVKRCKRCGNESFLAVCSECGTPIPGSFTKSKKMNIDISRLFNDAVEKLKEKIDSSDIKCVKGLISRYKVAEHIGKGILRAKHDVFVFKDGTIRYDLTNLPLTHFKPKEIGISVEKARELGYTEDIYGATLERDTQILELKQQDIIISEDAAEYLIKVCNFVDDLLEKFYGLQPYYKVSRKEDLIGQLVLAIAPHTSAGILGRIIGFTRASACFAHPFFHAAKRRNCDGDEDSIMLLLDALLNFSLSFLPEKRGGKMDAPLVLISYINPKEVDKESHNLSIAFEYPLDFFEATCSSKHPKDVDIDIAATRIEKPKDVYQFGYTHETQDIAAGPLSSLYKKLETMEEKIEAQLRLAKRIIAVDEGEVAELVIKNHFLRDIRGNLRAFGTQRMRCMRCNAKYRRVPLNARCNKCGDRLMPTVHAAGVRKYLDVSLRIAKRYGVSQYTMQRLELIKEEVDALFPVEEQQKALTDFM
ncbi:MAG: DNA polymerase II large subunit [Candidatus Methanospirareceae archaeon]